jgi:hypothetical protein
MIFGIHAIDMDVSLMLDLFDPYELILLYPFSLQGCSKKNRIERKKKQKDKKEAQKRTTYLILYLFIFGGAAFVVY